MVYFGPVRPDHVVKDLCDEFDLSPTRMDHISWLVTSGFMNREDVRRMLSREPMTTRYGLDTKAWPSLSAEPLPRKRRIPGPAKPQIATPRGGGGLSPRRLWQTTMLSSWIGVSAARP